MNGYNNDEGVEHNKKIIMIYTFFLFEKRNFNDAIRS
jgi:hypothetical protein